MKLKTLRLITGLLTSFTALTAIAGGLALLAGLEDFPLEWLEGTPFPDFTIPGFILICIVGGSSLVAAILVFTKHQFAGVAAIVAGTVMMGEIGVELIILNDASPEPHWIQVFYFLLGLTVFIIGGYIRREESTTDIRDNINIHSP